MAEQVAGTDVRNSKPVYQELGLGTLARSRRAEKH